MGYLKMISKGIGPTNQLPPIATKEPEELEQPPASITEPTYNIHDVYVQCFDYPLYDNINTIGLKVISKYII